ncbi:FAD-dependent monooxygenase [Streptomyces rugosispiralis]|uniref:FAD-dependent monooxygenase n=1 Tax=Streptomyces rugosispiralis TaxID=2967341 RepID=A0ABT1UTX9_9ACTN|nr:FAD-dependent monooxygenase [Streptomyces rugosispiralis]MCQ8188512.1 FAD-dependent monooxygenase [Streptomyces rugosispiralis]
MNDVVVVGAGPVGLLLAAELRLVGVDVTVIERAAARSPHSKALTLHPRSLEVLAMRGLAEPFVRAGVPVPTGHYGGLPVRLDFSVLDTRFPYTLVLPQLRTERLLEERLRALGGEIRRRHRALEVRQDADGAEVDVAGPDGTYTLRTAWVVGCDGAGSAVRTSAGIDFPGTRATTTGILGDVVLDAPPSVPSVDNEYGGFLIVPLADGHHRVAGSTRESRTIPADRPLTFEELRGHVRQVAGTDFGMRAPRWLSRFGNAARQAARYRDGRVLLAGDAAHMHMPMGGQGLNVGLQDAFNLGWKLAAVCQGRAPDGLLDTYHAERHPVGAALLENTQAQTVLGATYTPDARALRSVFGRLLAAHPAVNRQFAGELSALDVAYPADGADGAADRLTGTRPADRLTGTRAPDLGLDGAPEPSLYPLLADGRFVLLRLGPDGDTGREPADALATAAAIAGGPDRIRAVTARPTTTHDGWAGPRTVLVRPDGHVAWDTALSTK